MSKVIVITGAGAGLGKHVAQAYASDGHKVVLLGRTPSKVEAVASEIGGNAMALGCDVGSADSVRAAFGKIAERFPKIDVLINNAAIFQPSTIAEASDEHILSAITTNLAGSIFCARSAIPMMGPGGLIINVTSESIEVPFAHLTVYQSSKAGVEMFSTSLQRELEPQGIRVATLRAGQMYEEGKAWDVEPTKAMAFAQANAERGIHLTQRPISHMRSIVGVFRMLIDLPPDVQLPRIHVQARKPD